MAAMPSIRGVHLAGDPGEQLRDRGRRGGRHQDLRAAAPGCRQHGGVRVPLLDGVDGGIPVGDGGDVEGVAAGLLGEAAAHLLGDLVGPGHDDRERARLELGRGPRERRQQDGDQQGQADNEPGQPAGVGCGHGCLQRDR
jgi:hypothetical protein